MVTIWKPPQAAKYLRIHIATLRRMMRAHKIPAFRVATEWRFCKETLDKWMAEGGAR